MSEKDNICLFKNDYEGYVQIFVVYKWRNSLCGGGVQVIVTTALVWRRGCGAKKFQICVTLILDGYQINFCPGSNLAYCRFVMSGQISRGMLSKLDTCVKLLKSIGLAEVPTWLLRRQSYNSNFVLNRAIVLNCLTFIWTQPLLQGLHYYIRPSLFLPTKLCFIIRFMWHEAPINVSDKKASVVFGK